MGNNELFPLFFVSPTFKKGGVHTYTYKINDLYQMKGTEGRG